MRAWGAKHTAGDKDPCHGCAHTSHPFLGAMAPAVLLHCQRAPPTNGRESTVAHCAATGCAASSTFWTFAALSAAPSSAGGTFAAGAGAVQSPVAVVVDAVSAGSSPDLLASLLTSASRCCSISCEAEGARARDDEHRAAEHEGEDLRVAHARLDEHLVGQQLVCQREHRRQGREQRAAAQIRRAHAAGWIRAHAHAAHTAQITSGKEAKKLAGIGKSSADKIDEYLSSGKVAKLEEYKQGV